MKKLSWRKVIFRCELYHHQTKIMPNTCKVLESVLIQCSLIRKCLYIASSLSEIARLCVQMKRVLSLLPKYVDWQPENLNLYTCDLFNGGTLGAYHWKYPERIPKNRLGWPLKYGEGFLTGRVYHSIRFPVFVKMAELTIIFAADELSEDFLMENELF